ncbi:MAG: hypothetical protein H0Z28_13350 [Archaeoglobus sp.]|nr:hypothetical protein [Archaeoglobus sp.]
MEAKSSKLRDFNVSWFATILGSGGVALASLPFYPLLTLALTYILTFVFAILTLIWVAKIVRYSKTVKNEIQHVVIGNFYPLQPISAIILAILYHKLSLVLDSILLIYGSIAIFCMTVYLSYHFFANVTPQLSHIHGGWFIPPVSTILVTNALLLYPPSKTLFAISLIYFGMGTMLFLFIATILFLRLVNHELLPSELAPTNFILLAPVGILIVDFLSIFHHADLLFASSSVSIALIISISLWGFGLWALIVNIMLVVKYMKKEFPFFLGWWSYVFPTAAFTLGTIALSAYMGFFKSISIFMYGLLMSIWIVVTTRTIKLLIW